jgi:hypothetical protein
VNGVATFSNLILGTPGSYTLTAASSGLTSATSSGITIGAGAAAKLVFSSNPPSSGAAGTAFGAVVQVQDASGNVVTSSTASVTISSTAAGVSGTTTVAAVNGVATFSNLILGTPGSYTLSAASSGLTSATSTGITIGAAPQYVLNVSVTPSGGGSVNATIAGKAFSCSTACSATGTTAPGVVTLTATPAAGSVFSGWTGCSSTSGNTCTITLSGTVNVTAAFGGSSLVSTQGALVYNRSRGRYQRTVTVTNNGGAATTGPVAFALDTLSSGAALVSPDGITSASAPPAGSPYREFGVIAAHGSVTKTLEFTITGGGTITYSPRVLGPGAR